MSLVRKRGQALQKMRAEDNVEVAFFFFFFRKWSGISDRPAEGAVFKPVRAERLA